MTQSRQIRSRALRSLYDRCLRDNSERLESVREEFLKAEVARNLYNLRQEFGLTQEELAERTGIAADVISDLEESDYEGDALKVLEAMAAALDKRVVVDYLEPESSPQSQSPPTAREVGISIQ